MEQISRRAKETTINFNERKRFCISGLQTHKLKHQIRYSLISTFVYGEQRRVKWNVNKVQQPRDRRKPGEHPVLVLQKL